MSAIYYPTCPDTITDPLCTPCPTKELGGVRSIVLKKSTYTFADTTDPTEWTNAICNKNVYIIPFTRGSVAVTPVENAGFGDTSTVVDGFDYTLTVFDPNYTGNAAFWTDIFARRDFEVMYRTETQLHESDNTVSIAPMNPVEEDIKTRVLWNITIKWSQERPTQLSDIPVGIFDRCTQCS